MTLDIESSYYLDGSTSKESLGMYFADIMEEVPYHYNEMETIVKRFGALKR